MQRPTTVPLADSTIPWHGCVGRCVHTCVRVRVTYATARVQVRTNKLAHVRAIILRVFLGERDAEKDS